MKKNPKNAGRKEGFGEPTKPQTFRLPVSRAAHISVLFNRYLNKLKK